MYTHIMHTHTTYNTCICTHIIFIYTYIVLFTVRKPSNTYRMYSTLRRIIVSKQNTTRVTKNVKQFTWKMTKKSQRIKRLIRNKLRCVWIMNKALPDSQVSIICIYHKENIHMSLTCRNEYFYVWIAKLTIHAWMIRWKWWKLNCIKWQICILKFLGTLQAIELINIEWYA